MGGAMDLHHSSKPMLHVARWYILATAVGTGLSSLSSEEILTKVADSSIGRRPLGYSGIREYRLRNLRVAKEARVLARVTYHPREGKHFAVLERSGSVMLAKIVEKLLVFEADESRLTYNGAHAISPLNYQARLRGMESKSGRICYVMDLTPKYNSKYLIEGSIWVDPDSYGIVRVDGRTSERISMWVGSPRITEEFSEVAGLWLPSHTRAVSSGFLLGTSELEIRYTDYRIVELDHTIREDQQYPVPHSVRDR
jgi:hypothetical protein